jgi:hypothetical protein
MIANESLKYSSPLSAFGNCSFDLVLPFANLTPADNPKVHYHAVRCGVFYEPPDLAASTGPRLPWEYDQTPDQNRRQLIEFQRIRQQSITSTPHDACYESNVGHGRQLMDRVDVSLMRSWLSICENSHEDTCTISTDHRSRSSQPARVVDVEDMCLKDTPRGCRYVTLSYVWAATVLKLTIANSALLYQAMSLSTLDVPATILDAITLVRSMGERYIWVDSVCIIQDDAIDQKSQLSIMALIYTNAIFTIIATHGEDANAGLPGIRSGSRKCGQTLLNTEHGCLVSVVDKGGVESGVSKSRWNERGWTFQEKLLSARQLIFTTNQVYWQCRSAHFMEEVCLEGASEARLFKPSAGQTSWEILLPNGHLNLEEYCQLFQSLLNVYSQRQLSFESDILDAFSGICTSLADTQDDEFFWGLPQSVFTWALTWNVLGKHTRRTTRMQSISSVRGVEQVAIPSWTWAAWGALGSHQQYVEFLDRPTRSSTFEPLVHFDICQNDGTWRCVREQLAARKETKICSQTSSSNTSFHARPGLLRFRAHVTTMRFKPHGTIVNNKPGTLLATEYYADTLSKITRIQGDLNLYMAGDCSNGASAISVDDDGKERFNLDVIAICRGPIGDIIAIAAKYEDGIAYRVGLLSFTFESTWLSIPNMRKEEVILG